MRVPLAEVFMTPLALHRLGSPASKPQVQALQGKAASKKLHLAVYAKRWAVVAGEQLPTYRCVHL